MPRHSPTTAAVLALCLLSSGLPPAAAQTPVRIALTGTAAPGGSTYVRFDFLPAVNATRTVTFQAALNTGGIGVFSGNPGAVQFVARTGDPTPIGGTYGFSFGRPNLSAAGQVAFTADVNGGASSRAIFVGPPGTLQAAVVTGAGAPAGGEYGNNLPLQQTLNAAGQIAFTAELVNGSATRGLFRGAPGATQTVLVPGGAAPGGGTWGSNFTGNPALNAAGQVSFYATGTGPGGFFDGVFVGAPGAVQPVALRDAAAPGGGTYAGFDINSQVLNAAGQVTFRANINTGSAVPDGVFVGAPGAVQRVALVGTAAPAGGTYSSFGFDQVMNADGQVAFTATLTGGTAARGLFRGAPGAVEAVALVGDAAPGGGTFNTLTDPSLNAAGQVAFLAGLTGTGVTTANDRGLYVLDAGQLVKVVREGDVLDVDPGAGLDLRTVNGINTSIGFEFQSGEGDGRAAAFSDTGSVVYKLTFTDGSSGLFLTTVPEPAGMLAAAGLVAVAAVRLRRTRR